MLSSGKCLGFGQVRKYFVQVLESEDGLVGWNLLAHTAESIKKWRSKLNDYQNNGARTTRDTRTNQAQVKGTCYLKDE